MPEFSGGKGCAINEIVQRAVTRRCQRESRRLMYPSPPIWLKSVRWRHRDSLVSASKTMALGGCRHSELHSPRDLALRRRKPAEPSLPPSGSNTVGIEA